MNFYEDDDTIDDVTVECMSIIVCSYTKIKGNNLIELNKHVPSINRLSISYLDVDDNDLLGIRANC